MNRQQTLPLGSPSSIPVHEIKQMILDRGRLTKDEIKLLWDVSEEDYSDLKFQLEREKLFEPGPRGHGGFVARFNRAQQPAREKDRVADVPFRSDHERQAALRLADLLTYPDLEELLGPLVYTIRRARLRLSGEDRRGSKLELAAALLTQHDIDLFMNKEIRARVAKRARVQSPGRWHPGKGGALRFVESVIFPIEYAGIPAEESPPDFEYLEGRVDLAPLQDFQLEVQRKLFGMLDKPAARAIVTLPTGGGKTRVAVDTIRDWLTRRYGERRTGEGNTVLWLAHTDELCEQAYACFREVWQASSNVCPMLLFRFWGGYTRDLEYHREALANVRQRPTVFVSTPQRILNLINGSVRGGQEILESLRDVTGLIIIDEAHRAAAPTYRTVMSHFSAAMNRPSIIGLTATPFRAEYDRIDPLAGTRDLKELFGEIIEPKESLGDDPRATLQSRGFLARPIFGLIRTSTRLKAPAGVDVDNPSEKDIERIDYALKLRADKPERRLQVLAELVCICRDPSALVIYFGPTVQDAECMAFLLRQQGIEASFVSGNTRDVTRRKIIADFKAGRVQVLCNCEVLTTGFDAPKVTHVVMARPTVSQVLYEQMVGRGLRGVKFGGTETCHVIDLEDSYRDGRPELGYKRFRQLWQSRGGREPPAGLPCGA